MMNRPIAVFQAEYPNLRFLTLLEKVPYKVRRTISKFLVERKANNKPQIYDLEPRFLEVLFGRGLYGRKVIKALKAEFPYVKNFCFNLENVTVDEQAKFAGYDVLSGVSYQVF